MTSSFSNGRVDKTITIPSLSFHRSWEAQICKEASWDWAELMVWNRTRMALLTPKFETEESRWIYSSGWLMTLGSSATLFPDLPRLLEKGIPWPYSQANTGNTDLRLGEPCRVPRRPSHHQLPDP